MRFTLPLRGQMQKFILSSRNKYRGLFAVVQEPGNHVINYCHWIKLELENGKLFIIVPRINLIDVPRVGHESQFRWHHVGSPLGHRPTIWWPHE